MHETTRTLSGKKKQYPAPIEHVLLSAAGILIFAGFIHQSFPLRLIAIGGLAGTALLIAFSTRYLNLQEAFGTGRLNRTILLYMLPAAFLGVILGILTRQRFELTLIPAGFAGMVVVAPLIGAVEEFVFRGYMQGQLRQHGKISSVFYTSGLHTCYKLLVILTLSIPRQFDFFFLLFWTFIGGLLFGALRECSKSTIPPMLAHAVFDIVLYGGLATAPVWVWC